MRSLASQNVAGLEEGKKHILGRLLDEAQTRVQRLVNNAKLTEEEKMEKLEKIDAWIVGELQSVTSASFVFEIHRLFTSIHTSCMGLRSGVQDPRSCLFKL